MYCEKSFRIAISPPKRDIAYAVASGEPMKAEYESECVEETTSART
jgi:hypothetical protein